MKVYRIQKKYDVVFTRRTYGKYNKTTYTWAHIFINGEWESVGDPYPKQHFPVSILIKSIEMRLKNSEISNDYA